MSGIRDVVRDLLDGRENDEQITVEVSLLWSLLDAPPDEERLARALGVAGDAEGMHYWCKDIDGCGLYSDGRDFASAIAKAYREDTDDR